MLSIEELKSWLHHDLPRADKLLLVLGSFKAPCEVAEIRSRAKQAGFRIPTKWNISSILSGTKGKALRTPTGWELAESGQQRLKTIGVRKSIAAAQVATDLRTLLAKVKDHDTRAFVEEAVKCYEFELYRAAVVMSWLAAFHVLKKEVHENHLAAFNAEATRVDPKWRPAKTTDELGLMKEAHFLERSAAISVIGKNVKQQLQKCLDLRNACGHPNSLKVGAGTVTGHIEILMLNVLQPLAN